MAKTGITRKQIGRLFGEARSGRMLLMSPFSAVWHEACSHRFRTHNFTAHRLDQMLLDFSEANKDLVVATTYLEQGLIIGSEMVVEVRLLRGQILVMKAWEEWVQTLDLRKYEILTTA